MLIECMKNRSNERNDIFFLGGELCIGAVAYPEPKRLEQFSSIRKMPVDGSRSHAGSLSYRFVGEPFLGAGTQHVHRDIEDLFPGCSRLPATKRWSSHSCAHGSILSFRQLTVKRGTISPLSYLRLDSDSSFSKVPKNVTISSRKRNRGPINALVNDYRPSYISPTADG